MLVGLDVAVPVPQQVHDNTNAKPGPGFDGFDLRRYLETQKEGGFPETLQSWTRTARAYRIVKLGDEDGGDVLVIERSHN